MTLEQRIATLGKRINKIYKQANKELTEKVDSFFADFERLDKKKKALVDAGKLSEEAYKKWRKNKLLMGEKYKQLRDNVGQTMLEANKTAAAYINRDIIPSYATGYNFEGSLASDALKNYSFDLIDENAVKRLTTSNNTILPYKVVDGRRDVRWNTKKVNSAILQGIIQGESVPKIAKRLMNVTEMNRTSAIRNARTALTGAHNSGRQDAMDKMAKDGVILQKEWLATTGDSRTRDAHMELHHVIVDHDKPFENSIGRIMFPGDPNAHPANVYNCRCALATVVKGFRKPEETPEEEAEAEEESIDIEQLRSAADGATNKVEFWMNMTDEQQAIFNASGLSIDDAFNMFKNAEPVSEWKKAAEGDARSFRLAHDFSGESVRFKRIPARSEGWMADAAQTGLINVREDGLGDSWDFIIGHEAGHQLSNMFPELQQMIMTNPGNVLGRYNTRLMKFDGVYGEYNPEEAFATCVSNYIRHPDSMKNRYPEAYSAIDNLFEASPSAKRFVIDAMNAYRREFGL